jgi:energy-coupling factor transport system ATP-binding protein
MADAPVAPPVVALARLAGWLPLPLSVRDARRAAQPLRDRLALITPPVRAVATRGDSIASLSGVAARYGPNDVLHDIDFEIGSGEIVAVMGRNGAGKSTLLRLLSGLMRPTSGRIDIDGAAPHSLNASALVRRVGLVPSDPGALLYERTIASECSVADREHRLAAGTTRATLDRIEADLDPTRHPRDLSEGQRLALALAVVLAPAPPLILLDEPTRGLDYAAKARLSLILRELAATGHAVVLATHDVELVAETATRAIVLADGEIVSDGAAREVVCHSPVFAPQVAKILAPAEWLTVAEVSAALAS